MNAKERIRAVLQGLLPDRIPCHLNATKWVVEKLKKRLNVITDEELLPAIHIDTYDMRGIDIHHGTMPKYIGGEHSRLNNNWSGNFLDIWGIEELDVETPSGFYHTMGKSPLSEMAIGEMNEYPWPAIDWFDFNGLSEALAPWKEFGIIASGCSVWQHPTFIRGFEQLLVEMAYGSEMAGYVLDKVTEFYYEFFGRIFEKAGQLIDIMAIADDLGTQDSLLMSPDMIETYLAPRIKKIADLTHRYNIKLLFHSDGNIRSIIPLLINWGVDILDPLQPEAPGMDIAEIKQEFGNELVLRGGISVQDILVYGSTGQVRDSVRRTIDILGPGGGYILSPGHPVLQDDVPVENILTMYETAYEYGRYS